jgi:hypothetical protein
MYGDTKVQSNFLRLTADRQSQAGYLWSNKPIDRDQFAAEFTFRISGQAKSLYGDGIALWLVENDDVNTGALHGLDSKFKGAAIIFDTYVNTDQAPHRDVSIITNNGEQAYLSLSTDTTIGCNGDIRYHGKRSDFSALNSTRVVVEVVRNSIKVFLDAKNSGALTECFSTVLPFSESWIKSAHVGVSATTGHLADNQDVLSFLPFDSLNDVADYRAKLKIQNNGPESVLNKGGDTDTMINQLEAKVKTFLARIENIDHNLEYHLVKIREELSNMVNHLSDEENDMESRISHTEHLLWDEYDYYRMEYGYSAEGNDLIILAGFRERMEMETAIHHAKLEEHAESLLGFDDGGWGYAFAGISFLGGCTAFACFMFIRTVVKEHLI